MKIVFLNSIKKIKLWQNFQIHSWLYLHSPQSLLAHIGKGEKIPVKTVTNKRLLPLYRLTEADQQTWQSIEDLMENIRVFTDYPQNKYRSLLKKKTGKAAACLAHTCLLQDLQATNKNKDKTSNSSQICTEDGLLCSTTPRSTSARWSPSQYPTKQLYHLWSHVACHINQAAFVGPRLKSLWM